MATVSPTTKSPALADASPPDNNRIQSLQKFCQPNRKFSPPLWNAFCNTSGLVAAKLDGARTSSICRTENSTIDSFCFATPRTPVVTLCHHCSPSRKACANKLNGGVFQSGRAKRPSYGLRLIREPGPWNGPQELVRGPSDPFPFWNGSRLSS